jgi:putative spermidine/putrescine transport system substrate-binding protein
MRYGLTLGIVLGLTTALPAAAQQNMVFTSWGGTTQDAQKKDWAAPFTAATSIPVVQDGPTDYGKFAAMVQSGNVSWDVVDVEYDFAEQAAQKGLLTPLALPAADAAKIDPRFLTPYAAGSFYYSFVIGYRSDKFHGATPTTLADLFDTKKFPGKRCFYKWSAAGVLEAALLADGVAPDKLYPLDLDRAFKKLGTIKKDIVWWSTGAQSQQLLASGQAPMGLVWNGRVQALENSGLPVAMSWDDNLTTGDMLVIPKGAPHPEAAQKFIAYATSAAAQAKFAADTGYAPINKDSMALLDPKTAANLPQAHAAQHIDLNMAYWAAHRDEIATRWYAWQTQ